MDKERAVFGGGVAVITGAASGIGEGLARHAAALGMKVVLADIAVERMEAVAAEIRAAGGEAMAVPTDVTDAAAIDRLAAITHERGSTTVRLSDGSQTDVDLIVVGIGAEPNTDLAQAAGLEIDNGILVDAQLRTSTPGVYAAGDVANHDHPDLGRIRVEHWDNAIEQGRHAARSMLGETTPYTRQPYFYTDQYDLGMEYVGHVGPQGYDEVRIRGDLDRRVFTAWWIRDGVIVAGMHAGDWDAIHHIRQLVGKPATDLPC